MRRALSTSVGFVPYQSRAKQYPHTSDSETYRRRLIKPDDQREERSEREVNTGPRHTKLPRDFAASESCRRTADPKCDGETSRHQEIRAVHDGERCAPIGDPRFLQERHTFGPVPYA